VTAARRWRVDYGEPLTEGDLQNVLNFAPPRICFLSDIMLHISALSALTPRGSDLTAKN
jgi:hypothetical protein